MPVSVPTSLAPSIRKIALCAATLSLMGISAPLAAAESDNDSAESSPPTETISGAADRHERLTIPVTIDGQGPFNFMVDTGAQATVVTSQLNNKLNFRPIGQRLLVGMGDAERVNMVEVDRLEFGTRVFDGIEAPLLERNDLGADGIIGLDSLHDMRVVVNLRDNQLHVTESGERGRNRGYEIIVRARRKLGRLIITEAKISDITTTVIVDTGAQASIGNRVLERRLRMVKRDDVVTTDVLGNDFNARSGSTRDLNIGRAKLQNVALTFADGPAFAALGLANKPALVLGMRELRAFDRVAIDFAERRIFFDMPGGFRR